MTTDSTQDLLKVGWKEWAHLPDLGISEIKAKIDTGARTSALHAYKVETFKKDGADWVRFSIHPYRRKKEISVDCEAKVKDRRTVTDSGGHREKRIVIETTVQIGDRSWPIEVTLTNRESMLFRFLLGRTALRGRCLINPAKSYLLGARGKK